MNIDWDSEFTDPDANKMWLRFQNLLNSAVNSLPRATKIEIRSFQLG